MSQPAKQPYCDSYCVYLLTLSLEAYNTCHKPHSAAAAALFMSQTESGAI